MRAVSVTLFLIDAHVARAARVVAKKDPRAAETATQRFLRLWMTK